jgi:hypothetical protein
MRIRELIGETVGKSWKSFSLEFILTDCTAAFPAIGLQQLEPVRVALSGLPQFILETPSKRMEVRGDCCEAARC